MHLKFSTLIDYIAGDLKEKTSFQYKLYAPNNQISDEN